MNRRKLIMWTAPVVASIALPAHAEMSPIGCDETIVEQVGELTRVTQSVCEAS